jgi:hypothetical protein
MIIQSFYRRLTRHTVLPTSSATSSADERRAKWRREVAEKHRPRLGDEHIAVREHLNPARMIQAAREGGDPHRVPRSW